MRHDGKAEMTLKCSSLLVQGSEYFINADKAESDEGVEINVGEALENRNQ